MPDAAFLAAICAAPADDAPRLVYADWLEEHGDAARAEFIRVQCELARAAADGMEHAGLGPGDLWERELPDPNSCDCRWCALRRRERELLNKHGLSEWVPDGMAALVPIFRRGFIAAVALRLEDWCGRQCGCTQDGSPVSQQDCTACKGTGRQGALGPQLVMVAPIERLTFADAGAVRSVDEAFCVLVRRMPAEPWEYPAWWPRVLYPTAAAALDALSDDALAWARGVAFPKREEARGAD